jgi:hypothetical protein
MNGRRIRETLLPNAKGVGSAGVEDAASWPPAPRHKQSPPRPAPVSSARSGERWPTDERRALTFASREDTQYSNNADTVAASNDIEASRATDLGSMQQLDSLVTKLQSQEARLNWMIEAVRHKSSWMRGDYPTHCFRVLFTGDGGSKHEQRRECIPNC